MIRILFLLLTLITFSVQANDGLSYSTYYCASWPCSNSGTPLSTGTVPNINYNWGGGNILNSGRSDYVSVVFTGYIVWPGSIGMQKTVTFYVATDDGSLLKINNQSVINDWSGLHPAWQFNANGTITLTGGKLYPFEFWFSEWGGGAVAQLYWDIGNGPELVPNSAFFYNQQISGSGSGYFSEITDTQIQIYNDYITKQQNLPMGNHIYIDQQSGSALNNIRIEQYSNNNTVQGINGSQYATIKGQNNNLTIRQGEPNNLTGKNLLELNLIGNLNTLEINQARTTSGLSDGNDSNGHITRLNIIGSNNNLTTQQANTSTGPHFMSVDVLGNNNTLNLRQLGDSTKKMFSYINGDSNTLSAVQSDQGNHYLDVNLVGPNNTVNVNQKNSGSHRASINLVNAGGPNSLTLIQQGTINQVYSIIQSCVVSSGCGVNITQGQ